MNLTKFIIEAEKVKKRTAKEHSKFICCRGRTSEDAPLVEFMYLVFTRMPGESYSRRVRSLLFVLV